MMMNSVYTPVKNSVKYNEVPRSQHTEVREVVTPNSEREANVCKSDTSVYQRLAQASDKIEKWKTRLEMDSKLKDRKLGEALQTVEKLRSNVLELQAKSETLCRKLSEEIGSRDDVMQRLTATREMCTGLKNFASHVDMRLNQCEAEKEDLSNAVRDNTSQFKDLSEQFAQLTLTANMDQTKLADKLETEHTEKKAQEEEFKAQMSEIQTELNQQKEKCESKEQYLTVLQKNYAEKEDEIASLTRKYSEQKEELLQLKEAFTEREICITSLNHRCNEHETAIESLVKEKNELQNLGEFLRLEIDGRQTSMAALQNELSEKDAVILQLQDKVGNLQLGLESLQKKFDETVDQMTKELADTKAHEEQEMLFLKESADTEMMTAVGKLKKELDDISSELEKHKQQFENISEERRMLEVKLGHQETEISKLLGQLQKLFDASAEMNRFCVEEREKLTLLFKIWIKELTEEISSELSAQLETNGKENMMSPRHGFQEKLNLLQQKVEINMADTLCTMKSQTSDNNLTETQNEVERLTSFYLELSNVLFKELKTMTTAWENELKEKKKIENECNQQLQKCQTEIEKLLNEKDSKDEALHLLKELVDEAEYKVGLSKDEVETLTIEKQVKETQLENSRTEISSLKVEIEKLDGKLNAVQASAEENAKKLTCQVENALLEKIGMEQDFLCQVTRANKEKEELKKLCDQLRTEKEFTENRMKTVASELTSSLTSYKKGWDDVVARKDREIEEERIKTAAETKDLNKQLVDLQIELDTLKMEKTALSLKLSEVLTNHAVIATPLGKGKENKDERGSAKQKEKGYEAINRKSHKTATPLKPSKDEVSLKTATESALKRTPNPLSKTAAVIATVTPTPGKKTAAPVKVIGKKMKTFEDAADYVPAKEETDDLFASQHGILCRSVSLARKRSVIFASSQQSDDSSASELLFIPPVKSPCYRTGNNTKKVIEKKDGKAFYKTTSVRETKPQRKQTTKDQTIAWFDSDAVFGFGPED